MKFAALTFLFALASGPSGNAAGVGFPGKATCVSPDRKWCILCESQEQDKEDLLPRLFLNRLGEAKKVPVWSFGRSCDVLWSNDSRRMALTDWAGSNFAEIWLVDLSNPSNAVQLEVKNVQTIAQKAELEGHCYYEAVRWEGAQQLLIRVFGHTEEVERAGHGFTYYLSVNTASGLAKLVKKFDEEDVRLTAGLLKYQPL